MMDIDVSKFQFNPAEGKTILEPEGKGFGHWIGAAHAYYDKELKKFFLYVRVRNPRPVKGKVTPFDTHRGYKCQILESSNGDDYNVIWKMKKSQINAKSMEGAALTKIEGKYHLILSFETRGRGARWNIKRAIADHPSKFDPKSFKNIDWDLPALIGFSIKDPNIFYFEGKYYLSIDFFRFWKKPWGSTGLLVSNDGYSYKWLGDIIENPKRCSWTTFMVRITSIIREREHYIGFLDAAKKGVEICEERSGLVAGKSLIKMNIVSCNNPLYHSEYGKGSCRYFFALKYEKETWLFYEYTEKQGEHVLKLYKIK